MEQLLISPYTVGPPVNEQGFYGRAELMRQVVQDLASTNVILLQGQRRVGKSSLLQQLRSYMLNMEVTFGVYRPIMIDIQAYLKYSLPEFQYHMARSVAHQLGLNSPIYDETEWSSQSSLFIDSWLPETLDSLSNSSGCSVTPVILMDEFDNLGESTKGAAWGTLVPFISQVVAREARIKWIFVVGRYIGRLPIQYDPIVSQAKKRFVNRLTREETKDLTTKPALGQLSFDDTAIARIWELANGHPHLTQALCSEIFSYVVIEQGRNTATKSDVDAVIPNLLIHYDLPITSIAHVPPVEERVLAIVANLAQGDIAAHREKIIEELRGRGLNLEIDELDRTLDILVAWDLLEPYDQGWRTTIEVVRLWLVKNVSLEPTREQKLDLLKARAQSRIESAKLAFDAGQIELAIKDYEDVLNNSNPMHIEALRGLADCYSVEGDLAKKSMVLLSLYRQDPTVVAELVTTLDGCAREMVYQQKLDEAGKCYEDLIKLQGNEKWQAYLAETRLKQVDQLLADTQEVDSGKPISLNNSRFGDPQYDALRFVSKYADFAANDEGVKEISDVIYKVYPEIDTARMRLDPRSANQERLQRAKELLDRCQSLLSPRGEWYAAVQTKQSEIVKTIQTLDEISAYEKVLADLKDADAKDIYLRYDDVAKCFRGLRGSPFLYLDDHVKVFRHSAWLSLCRGSQGFWREEFRMKLLLGTLLGLILTSTIVLFSADLVDSSLMVFLYVFLTFLVTAIFRAAFRKDYLRIMAIHMVCGTVIASILVLWVLLVLRQSQAPLQSYSWNYVTLLGLMTMGLVLAEKMEMRALRDLPGLLRNPKVLAGGFIGGCAGYAAFSIASWLGNYVSWQVSSAFALAAGWLLIFSLVSTLTGTPYDTIPVSKLSAYFGGGK